jgi:hypothetical protein
VAGAAPSGQEEAELILLRRFGFAFVASLTLALVPLRATAGTIVANCTGMVNFDIYRMDPDLPTQDVEGIGQSEFSRDESSIRLRGDFGEYRFDLKVGTLYLNDSDTGVYCTYSGLDG